MVASKWPLSVGGYSNAAAGARRVGLVRPVTPVTAVYSVVVGVHVCLTAHGYTPIVPPPGLAPISCNIRPPTI
jgi:hypothetical protein